MLYQDNVAVVDENLAGEEDQGLHRFTKRIAEVDMAGNRRRQLGCGSEIGHCHGGGIGCDDSVDPCSQHDHQQRSEKPNQPFQNQARRKRAETISSLDEATTAAKWNIKGSAY